MASWERGYGDFVMRPDLGTLRLIPWQEGTAMCLADLVWHDGSDVVASPRQILRRQLDRLAERGWTAFAGTELEFIVFRDSYEEAHDKGYRSLEPANQYNVDYSLLGTARVEPLIRRIRNGMEGAGMRGRGLQGGVQPRPARDQLPLRGGAAHRRRARDLQERGEGDRRGDGHGDHVHGEVQRARGQLVPHPLLARRREGTALRARVCDVRLVPRRSARGVARADAAAGPERQLLQALRGRLVRADGDRVGPRQPHVRAARDRPRAVAALREPRGRRGPQPLPRALGVDRGGVARGRCGIGARSGVRGGRLLGSRASPPADDARRTQGISSRVRRLRASAFGEDVVAHYVNAADVELAAFGRTVTDWERYRGFERL